jgi:hypothetical protein
MNLLVSLPQQLQQLMPQLDGEPVDMLLALYIALGVLAVRLISEKLLLPPLNAAFKARLQGSDSEPYKIRKRVSATAASDYPRLMLLERCMPCCVRSPWPQLCKVAGRKVHCASQAKHWPGICRQAGMLSARLSCCHCSMPSAVVLQHEHQLRLSLCHAAVSLLACLHLQLYCSSNQWPELCSAYR